MPRFLNAVLITATLTAGVAFAQQRDQPRDSNNNNAAAVRYHDKQHNDDHEWNNREDQAYKIWERDSHRKKEVEFNRLKRNDQQAYWNWRHNHSDAELKIDIR